MIVVDRCGVYTIDQYQDQLIYSAKFLLWTGADNWVHRRARVVVALWQQQNHSENGLDPNAMPTPIETIILPVLLLSLFALSWASLRWTCMVVMVNTGSTQLQNSWHMRHQFGVIWSMTLNVHTGSDTFKMAMSGFRGFYYCSSSLCPFLKL